MINCMSFLQKLGKGKTAMPYIGFFERLKIPRYDDSDAFEWGTVTVDQTTCSGCTLCIKVCPSNVLEMTEKKVHMKPVFLDYCLMCGVCAAICPNNSITCKSGYRYSGMFKTIGFGDLMPPRL